MCFESRQVWAVKGGGQCGKGSVAHKIAPFKLAIDYTFPKMAKALFALFLCFLHYIIVKDTILMIICFCFSISQTNRLFTWWIFFCNMTPPDTLSYVQPFVYIPHSNTRHLHTHTYECLWMAAKVTIFPQILRVFFIQTEEKNFFKYIT